MYKEDLPADAKPRTVNHCAACFYHYQRAAIGGHVGAMLRVASILAGRNTAPELEPIKSPQLAAFYLSNAAVRGSKAAALACIEHYLAPTAPDWAKAADFIHSLVSSSSSGGTPAAADSTAAGNLTMSKLSVTPLPDAVEGDEETWGWPAEFNSYELQARLAEMRVICALVLLFASKDLC
jgi:hypothetical protein